ncbi:MAG: helix-turn-helix transcriptional regulator [Anaerolineales bacterium]|nr:helix-turn-helix transcriptional regulator [Anaerolineales bacterium]
MVDEFQQPDEYFEIDSLETLKVITDEKRLQILDILAHKPATAKILATAMSVPPTKLYYHIKLLEEHGLIRVVDTQLVSGIVEKTYRARARQLGISESLLRFTEDSLDVTLDLVGVILDHAKSDLRRSIEAGLFKFKSGEADHASEHGVIMSRSVQLTNAQAEHLKQELARIIRELPSDADQQDNPDAHPYSTLFVFFPLEEE